MYANSIMSAIAYPIFLINTITIITRLFYNTFYRVIEVFKTLFVGVSYGHYA